MTTAQSPQTTMSEANGRPGEENMTMQDVREWCYDIRHYTTSVMGYIELGRLEKAAECAKRVDEMALKMLIDATEAAKGTPDYKPNPFRAGKVSKPKPTPSRRLPASTRPACTMER